MKKYIIMIVIILTISGLSAYDETYVVNQNGPGDYTDIMSAVNAVQTSATILVVGTSNDYTGVNNTNISWNGSSKTIRIYGVNDPVIDCNDQSRAFYIENGTEGDIIQDITINNAHSDGGFFFRGGGAILIENGNPILDGIVFNNCSAGEYPCNNYWPGPENGGAVEILYANGAQVKNCTFNNNIAFNGGAIYVISSDNVLFSNNVVSNNRTGSTFANVGINTYTGVGAGAFFGGCNNTIIENNFFYFNRTNHGASALFLSSGGNNSINGNRFTYNTCGELDTNCQFYEATIIGVYNSSGEINDNIFDYNYAPDQPCNIIYNTSNVLIKNNSFIENQDITQIIDDDVYGELLLSNCIFLNNDCDNISSGDVTLNYCSTYQSGNLGNGVVVGTGCLIDTNPQLDPQTYQPLWNSTIKSKCIDAGDPTVSDDDGTPSDIGAIPAVTHKYDIVELPSPEEDNNGWKWLSFPALDTVFDDADIAENVLADILDPAILDIVEAQDYTIEWNGSYWLYDYEQFSRTEGFKFLMNDDYDLEVPGFKVDDNTSIVLNGNNVQNWIGYWLEDTQHVSEAFEDYWSGSNIHFIQHQFWTAYRWEGEWYYRMVNEVEPTLSYGDMVIVKCLTTINNFQWESGITVDKTVFAKPEYFTYEEQADYIPLYIELDSGNMPQEIGAFVNGECIGAVVVGSTLTQINAYTTSVPPGDIELELYYGNRSENKHISSYNCVTSSNPNIIMKQLSTKMSGDAWFIDLREDSSMTPTPGKMNLDNYPNPFNPTTTIAYSLPSDGLVELRVFNIKGQLVKTLVKGEQLAGSYEAVWNGKDNNEKSVSSGIYFYKLSTRDETIMKKMLMLK